MVADLAGCILSLAFLQGSFALAGGGAQSRGISKQVLYATSAAYGLSMASIFPSAVAYCEEKIDVIGKSASYFVVGAALGEMVIPLTTGLLFDTAG